MIRVRKTHTLLYHGIQTLCLKKKMTAISGILEIAYSKSVN